LFPAGARLSEPNSDDKADPEANQERVPFFVIAAFFHVAKGMIQQHWKRPQHGLFAKGRRPVLSNEVMM
jgi:hypothetical protein